MRLMLACVVVLALGHYASAQFPDVIGRGGAFPDATNAVARTYAAQQYMLQQQYVMQQRYLMQQAYAQQMNGYGYGYESMTPYQAENGDFRNFDNDFDGRREPNHVQGYYRRNGDYTRGHYRAVPRW